MDILKLNFEDIENLSDEQVSEVIDTIKTSTNKDDLLIHLIDIMPLKVDKSKLTNLMKITTQFKEDYERLLERL